MCGAGLLRCGLQFDLGGRKGQPNAAREALRGASVARQSRLQRWLAWARKHWLVTVWLAVVALFGGIKIIIEGYNAIVEARAPSPAPQVVQIEQVPKDFEAYDLRKARWVVTVENPTDQPLLITRAHYQAAPLAPAVDYQYAQQIKLSRNVYKLPLNCKSGAGARPLVPPFAVPPKGSASLVIEADRKDGDCYFMLAFDTTQGRTLAMEAKPF